MSADLIRHRLDIRLDAPTLVGTGELRGNTRPSRDWIPGETILGALAGASLRDCAPGGPLPKGFVETFRWGRFGPAMAVGSWRTPMSVASCKYRTRPECLSRSWSDLAWESASGTHPGGDLCPVCKRGLELGKGTVSGAPLDARMHVELGANESGVDENLFRRLTLRRGTRLVAHAWLPEPRSGSTRVRIGGAQSTQGAAEITFAVEQPEPVSSAVLDHLAGTGEIVVRLASPGILVDQWGRPAASASAWQWQLEQRFPGLGARVSRQWTRWGVVGGWRTGGLPKPSERVLEAGSVFTIAFESPPDQDQLQGLRDLGLGLRTNHGFGWVELEPAPRPEPPPAPAAGAAAADPVEGFARSHPDLRSKLSNVLRELEGRPIDSRDIDTMLGRRSWFKACDLSTQEALVALLAGIEDYQGARERVDQLRRLPGGEL